MRSFESPILNEADIALTTDSIAAAQQNNGCIPWFEGGDADPWDHIEAAMALGSGGLLDEAARAYEWLATTQRPDGAWCARWSASGTCDPTLDANFSAYAAVGVWHHWLAGGDHEFLDTMWPVVERAIDFALDLQLSSGVILWARDASYRPWPGALLTSCSCIHLSLRCAIALAEEIGCERPDWELSLSSLGKAITSDEQPFEPKDRFSMDWYYPVLGGVLEEEAARTRLTEQWDRFVVTGLGARCVSDRPWITTAETCELVIALHSVGRRAQATALFEWIQELRAVDGSYWTGATFPNGTRWPAEKTTWSSAAVVLAAHVLADRGPASAIFRGQGLPTPLHLSEPVVDTL
jgi:hypothetical protein